MHRSNERQIPHPQGGQHRASVGYSTIDSETNSERIEHLRRLNLELGTPFNAQAALDCYTTKAALADFTAAWEAIRFGAVCGREW